MAKVKINPSEFRKGFRFENFNKSQLPSSGFAEDWNGEFNTRGKWEYVSGQRDFETGGDRIITVYRATCYWRSALESMLTKDTRLIYENTTYRIENFQRVNEQRQFYQFTVSEAH